MAIPKGVAELQKKKKNQVTYKGKPIRLTPDFSVETMKDTTRLLYPAELSFTIDGENKIFNDKNRFKQYVSINPDLQKVLEGKPQPKEANYTHNNTGI